jgi:hypothetical protein
MARIPGTLALLALILVVFGIEIAYGAIGP